MARCRHSTGQHARRAAENGCTAGLSQSFRVIRINRPEAASQNEETDRTVYYIASAGETTEKRMSGCPRLGWKFQGIRMMGDSESRIQDTGSQNNYRIQDTRHKIRNTVVDCDDTSAPRSEKEKSVSRISMRWLCGLRFVV